MTFIHARNLAPEEITHLGENVRHAMEDDLQSVDALHRSLSSLGEDDIEWD